MFSSKLMKHRDGIWDGKWDVSVLARGPILHLSPQTRKFTEGSHEGVIDFKPAFAFWLPFSGERQLWQLASGTTSSHKMTR